MKIKQVKYYSYKRLRKITAPMGRPWHAEDSDLRVVKAHHAFDTFDELVDYLDNNGTEAEIIIWAVSPEIPTRIIGCPTRLEEIYEHGTVFNSEWYSFELNGWVFYKQRKSKQGKKKK